MYQNNADETTLIADIGNTNITCGIYQNDKLTWFSRFFSSTHRTTDEYYSFLNPMLKDLNVRRISSVAIASVVPELTRMWVHLFHKYFDVPVLEISASSDLGLSYKVDDPSIIGADLIANAYGAWKKYNSNSIIIDLGTATSIQFITEKGCFEGASLAPGIKTAAENLFDKAALLSQIEIEPPKSILGTNTRDALLSGIVNGHAYMLESFIQRIKLQYFEYKNILTVATGGISDLMKPLVPSIDIVDKTLTLDGIYLAQKNIQNQ